MASGHEKHKERLAVLSSFGKELTRRCKSRCELCESGGVKLEPFELEPVPAEPDFANCVMICQSCALQMGEPRKFIPGEHWRCLVGIAWSEVPAVQVAAVRLLHRQANSQAWAREALEGLFLEKELEDWVTKAR